jgi:formamidopyrimidine-DNA glycosylase
MPELPEVETVRRGLEATLPGRRIVRAELRRAGLRAPFPKKFAEKLEGRKILAVRRRAKYLLIALDGGETVVGHLGMSGRITLLPPKTAFTPEKHDHVVLRFDDKSLMVFADPRRFGSLDLVADAKLETYPAFRALGPEPLGNEFSGAYLLARFAKLKTSMKAALMDQRNIAGLGNIYVCEALFRAGIDPRRSVGTLTGKEAEKLAASIRAVLEQAIEQGGSSLRDYRRTGGELGYFQHHFKVYGREGEACPGCRCDPAATGGIQRITQGGRSTFFCPRCQN